METTTAFAINKPSAQYEPRLTRAQRKMIDNQLKRLERGIRDQRHSMRKTKKAVSFEQENDEPLKPIPLNTLLKEEEFKAVLFSPVKSVPTVQIQAPTPGPKTPKSKALTVELEQTQQQTRRQWEQIDELKVTNQLLHVQMDRLKDENAFLIAELQEFKDAYSALAESSKTQAATVSALQEQCASHTIARATMRRQLNSLERDKEEEVDALRREYFYALSLATKMSMILQGQAVSQSTDDLWERQSTECPNHRDWPRWFASLQQNN
jgi:septal ring factor EnvC (AmiA/AmiB activator)